MNRFFILTMALTATVFLSGCTENSRTKNLGGNMTMNLPCGEKLFDLTWKEMNFWYATRPMRTNEFPETYKFREESELGILEGTVTIIECR